MTLLQVKTPRITHCTHLGLSGLISEWNVLRILHVDLLHVDLRSTYLPETTTYNIKYSCQGLWVWLVGCQSPSHEVYFGYTMYHMSTILCYS